MFRRTVSPKYWLLIPALLAGPAWAQAPKHDPRAAAELYVKYAEAVREQVLTPASCPFSPSAVVMNVGTDPAKLAEWVRTNIRYEPYVGVQRGVEGALAAGAGNDWDRALVYQALLQAAGYKTTLQLAKRTPEEALAVVDAYLTAKRRTAANDPEAPAAEPQVLKDFGINIENQRHYAAAERARVRRLVVESLDMAIAHTPFVLDTLAPVAKLGRPYDAWRQELVRGAEEFVQVQVHMPDGAKVFDITDQPAPKAAFADATAPAPTTFELKLLMTTAEEDKPAAEPVVLMHQVLPLGEMFRQPIRFEIVPCDERAAAKPVATWSRKDWHSHVSRFQEFQAMFRCGEEWHGSKVFNLAGEVLNVQPDGRVDNASKIGGGVTEAFGGMFGGGEKKAPEQPKSRIESLVLVLSINTPGEPPRVQERLLFGKDRPDVTPLYTADISAAAGPITHLSMNWLLLDAVVRNAPTAANIFTSNDPKRFGQTEGFRRLPTMLYDWQALRHLIGAKLIAGQSALKLQPGAGVVMHTVHITLEGEAVKTRHGMDVVFDDARVIPTAADAADAAAKANVTFGIASTVLESALLRDINPAGGAGGAYTAFEESRVAGKGARGFADAKGLIESKPLPVVAWSMARNEDGRALILPGAEGARSWWSIDPATGVTIGRSDSGEGNSALEYVNITKKNVDNLKCMVAVSNQLLGGDDRNMMARIWMLCMLGADAPASGHGLPGAAEGWYDLDPLEHKITGIKISIGTAANVLGGAKDLYDMMNGSDPILFTGR